MPQQGNPKGVEHEVIACLRREGRAMTAREVAEAIGRSYFAANKWLGLLANLGGYHVERAGARGGAQLYQINDQRGEHCEAPFTHALCPSQEGSMATTYNTDELRELAEYFREVEEWAWGSWQLDSAARAMRDDVPGLLAELARLREALVEERTKFLHSRRLDRGDASTWESAKALARQTLTAEGLLP